MPENMSIARNESFDWWQFLYISEDSGFMEHSLYKKSFTTQDEKANVSPHVLWTTSAENVAGSAFLHPTPAKVPKVVTYSTYPFARPWC